MGNLKEVRSRIASVRNTQTITKAMKVVAAARLRKAQSRIVQMRPYAQKLRSLVGHLATSIEGSEAEVFYSQRPVERALVIVVTSDRGLAGSFNSTVVKEAVAMISAKLSHLPKERIDILPVGKKGRDSFRRFGYNLVEPDNNLFALLTYQNSNTIADYVLRNYRKGTYQQVYLVFNQFKNAATYLVQSEQFLPIVARNDEGGHQADYIFEPDRATILAALVEQSLRVGLFRAFLDSNASEHGARMTAMDKATENAEDLLRQLRLAYNKERQASITKEILEIVGGAAALKG